VLVIFQLSLPRVFFLSFAQQLCTKTFTDPSFDISITLHLLRKIANISCFSVALLIAAIRSI